jgi:glutaredoxin
MVELKVVKVEGEKNDHRVFLYALSTCGWCKKTKMFLKENNIAYEYIDVDFTSSEQKKEIGRVLQEKNVPISFPITVIDDNTIVVGFKPDRFREALDL